MRTLNLKRIRQNYNVTQGQISQLTGYPQGFISLIENKRASVPMAFIEKLKESLHIEDITQYIGNLEKGSKIKKSKNSNSAFDTIEILKNQIRHKDEIISSLTKSVAKLTDEIAALRDKLG